MDLYGRRRRLPRYGGGGNDVFAFVLLVQLLQKINNLPYKPPITIGTIGILAFLFYAPHEMSSSFGPLRDISVSAFNPMLIVDFGEWHRIWTSPLIHASATHLYYNLVSFLYKGVALESAFGESFGLVLVSLTLLTQIIFLILSWIVTMMGWMPEAWITSTVGFSGTIFALKVILNSMDEIPRGLDFSSLFGLNLPWNKVVWTELFLAHFLVPQSSFLGHLSGILAGILFTFLNVSHRNGFFFSFLFRRRARFNGHGTTQESTDVRNETPQTAGLSPEELRRRRVNRFS